MAEVTLHASDWLVLTAYVVLTFAIAIRVRMGQQTEADYFLAGRNTHWILIGISMYATLFSTISFVSMPGEGYKHGLLLSLGSIGYALFTPLAVWMFLRFFYSTTSFTAYEYLERRFDLHTRTLGALMFLLLRMLYGALVFFAASKAFETLIGWPPAMTIGIIGVMTILYSYIGGMRAIIITDFVQTIVIFGGLILIIFKLSALIDWDFGAAWQFAVAHDHGYGRVAEREFWSIDPHLRFTFWTWLVLALMGPLTNYGTDQLVVQRILASKSYEAAKKAIILKTVGAVPFSLLFYCCGILLFFYFNGVVTPPEGVEADSMMGFFINQYLPSPIPGLIAASMMAALMSTFDSTLNSLSTVLSVDVLQRRRLVAPGTNRLRLGRFLTLGWGSIMLGMALFLTWASRDIETTIAEVANILSCLWGVLLVVVMAGVFTKWATARAANWALILGGIVNIVAPWKLYYGTPPVDRISFVWVGTPGWILALVVVVVVSLRDKSKNRQLDGLTWSTKRVPR